MTRPVADRRRVAALLMAAGAGLFAWSFVHLRWLLGSAVSYRMHHEVGAPFAVFLCWPIAGTLAVAAAVRVLKGPGDHALVRDPWPLLGLIPVLLALSLIFENEAFFSLYDPKGFPVHPPEIVAFPFGHWVTPRTHAFAAGTLCVLAFAIARVARRAGASPPTSNN